MKKNCFTSEQQEQLRANPYIEKLVTQQLLIQGNFEKLLWRNIKPENSHLKS